MKRIGFNILLLLTLTAVLAPDSAAQSRKARETLADDEFGERLGAEIERAVARITKHFEDPFTDDDVEADTIPSRVRRKTYYSDDEESESNSQTYSGNTTIEAGKKIEANVVNKGGDLTVYGTINGDALVVGGDLIVKSGGTITGNARVINGSIVKEEGGVIEGYEDKTRSTSTTQYRTPRTRFERSGTGFNVPWLNENGNLDNFIIRYNRVESIFLGFGSEKKFYWDGRKNWASFGSFGWGFKSHLWRGNIGLARQFPLKEENNNHLLELGAEAYSLTDTKDQWLIGVHENSAAAFFIHEDFRDYFTREGYTAHVAHYFKGDAVSTELKLAYLADRYESMQKNIDWALFGGEKTFRANDSINDGEMRSVMASFGLNSVSKTVYGPEGWTITATSEMARTGFGSDFDFTQHVLDIRRYQPLGRSDNLNIRLRVGTGDDNMPLQKIFQLGGLSTLHAFPFKQDMGNRMMLANVEYIVNGSFLDDLDFWPTWLFRSMNFLFISDAGWMATAVSTAKPTDGFDGIRWSDFKHNFGFGFANRSGTFRIGVAWRTDVKEPGRLFFRFNRPF